MVTYGPSPDRVTKLTMIAVLEKVKKYDEAASFRKELGMNKVVLRKIDDDDDQIMEKMKKTEKTGKRETTKSIQNTEIAAKKSEINDESQKEITMKKYGELPLQLEIEIDQSTDQSEHKSVKIMKSIDIKQTEPFSSGIRISPAGTLREKLMENGRRRIKIFDEVLTNTITGIKESGDPGSESGIKYEYVNSEGVSMKDNFNYQTLENFNENKFEDPSTTSNVMTKNPSEIRVIGNQIDAEERGVRRGTRWEKGGGGAASVIILLGLSGKNYSNHIF